MKILNIYIFREDYEELRSRRSGKKKTISGKKEYTDVNEFRKKKRV
jgi:hypothetical protein